jgi:hypothetical protein
MTIILLYVTGAARLQAIMWGSGFVRQSARRKLIALLLGVILALLGGEGLLARFDPLGFGYYRDQANLNPHLVADPRGYTFQPGTYTLSASTFTILADGNRAVPDTASEAKMTLVFMGDSVTFGYGVDDDQSWVSLVARGLPGVHVINAGVSGFNSTNGLRTLALYPDAQALVYLIINNDAYPENRPNFGQLHPPPAETWLETYLLNLPDYLFPPIEPPNDLPRYLSDLRQMSADSRVLLVGFDDDFSRMTIRDCCAVSLIERGTDRVSPADGHPGVRGNQQIAAQMLPLVRQRFGL